MTRAPVIYLSNFASRRTRGHHGAGRLYTIMARPRAAFGEFGEGAVFPLQPVKWDLLDVKAGRISIDEYHRRTVDRWDRAIRAARGMGIEHPWAPGRLHAFNGEGVVVRADDTLCCCCSREAAARGECHRAWAAPRLVAAGWAVVLDGKRFKGKGV